MRTNTLSANTQIQMTRSLINRSSLILISMRKVILRAQVDTCCNTLALAIDEYVNCVPQRKTLSDELFYFNRFLRHNLPSEIEIKNKSSILIAAESFLKR